MANDKPLNLDRKVRRTMRAKMQYLERLGGKEFSTAVSGYMPGLGKTDELVISLAYDLFSVVKYLSKAVRVISRDQFNDILYSSEVTESIIDRFEIIASKIDRRLDLYDLYWCWELVVKYQSNTKSKTSHQKIVESTCRQLGVSVDELYRPEISGLLALLIDASVVASRKWLAMDVNRRALLNNKESKKYIELSCKMAQIDGEQRRADTATNVSIVNNTQNIISRLDPTTMSEGELMEWVKKLRKDVGEQQGSPNPGVLEAPEESGDGLRESLLLLPTVGGPSEVPRQPVAGENP